MKKYQILYVDPPYDYVGSQYKLQGKILNSRDAYPTLGEELKTLDIQSISDENSLLFLWTTSPHLQFAIEVGLSWGFKYSTIAFVWNKRMLNPGLYTVSQIEICLLFKKGKIPMPRGSRKERQFLTETRKKHSRKPDEIRDRIEKMFPKQRKIELFAREKTKGWDVWGNEVKSKVKLSFNENNKKIFIKTV